MIDYIEKELKQANADLSDFRRIVNRLLNHQAIYRRQSQVEGEDYDLYLRLEAFVKDYLGVLGFTLVHHSSQRYVVCYPPGAEIPGVYNDDTEHHHYQQTLRRNEKIMLITARYLFEELLREGKVSDEGVAFIDLEKLSHTFAMIAKQPLDKESEREELLKFLKRLRIAEYKDASEPDAYIGIRSTILCYTLNSVLDEVNRLLGVTVDQEEGYSVPDDFSLEMTDDEDVEG